MIYDIVKIRLFLTEVRLHLIEIHPCLTESPPQDGNIPRPWRWGISDCDLSTGKRPASNVHIVQVHIS